MRQLTLLVVGVCWSVLSQAAETLPAAADTTAQQISLEVRFVTGPRSLFATLRKQHTLRTPAEPPALTLPAVSDEVLARDGGIHLLAAASVVETLPPVYVERLGDEQVRALLAGVAADEQATILLAPKVTLFDGRVGTIADVTARPFVIGLQQDEATVQPRVRAYEEGTRLLARCTVRPNNTVRVDFRGRLSAIEDVGLLEVDEAGATLQVPTVRAEDIQLAAELASGQTLAVHSVLSWEAESADVGVPIIDKVPYVSKMFRGTKPARTEQVILLTPRILSGD